MPSARTQSQAKVVDEVDLKLLELVRTNGRITLTAIAEQLGLSKSAVKYRMTELVSRGIIKSFFALVDSAVYGVTLSVLFDLTVEQRIIQDVATKLASYDEVIRVYELANSPDLHVHALFRDNEHFESFIRSKLYSMAGIKVIKSGIIMKRYKAELTLTI